MATSSGEPEFRLPEYSPELARVYREKGLWRDRTLAQEFHLSALRHSARASVITAEHTLTYQQLADYTDTAACGLLSLGLQPGDRVLIQVSNTLESVIGWYSLLKAGLVPVCALPSHRRYEVDQLMESTKPKAHLVQGGRVGFDLIDFALGLRDDLDCIEHVITIQDAASTEGTVPLEDLINSGTSHARARIEEVQTSINPSGVAVLLLSGGTTDTPKLIPRRHHEYWYNVRARRARWKMTAADRIGYILPLFHNAGIQTALHLAHEVGAALVLDDPDPTSFGPLFRAAGVTQTLLPVHYAEHAFEEHPDVRLAIQAMNRLVLTLGEVPGSFFEAVSAAGTIVLQDYGMSEGLCMTHSPEDSEQVRRETVGYPLSALDDVRLREDDRLVAPSDGDSGELAVRGPYTIPGYFDAPLRNSEVFSRDGFYFTGDLVSARSMGGVRYYSVDGRIKDLISRGGEKINANEVESLLSQHPKVIDAAIVAMPDRRLGERPCAYVTTDGANLPLSEVQRYLHSRGLAKYKWPERVEVVEQLPRSPVGKVLKGELRHDIASKVEGGT